jgi:hypothetical protein
MFFRWFRFGSSWLVLFTDAILQKVFYKTSERSLKMKIIFFVVFIF